MKILFVNLPSVKKVDGEYLHQLSPFPLGILYLSAYLKEYTDSEVRLLDIHISQEIDFEPDIIAYSVIFSSSHGHFVEWVNILKKKFPKAKHIAGGIHASNAFKQVGKYVDHVFIGEAEHKLVECINNGFLTKYIKCEPIDIKNILLPDWELLDMEVYLSKSGRAMVTEHKKTASIQTTRGCPYKCTFCSAFTVHGRKIRYRNIDNVINEVKTLNERYGINLFTIEDDLFLVPKARCLELLTRLKELNIDGFELQFPNSLSVRALNKDVIDALISAGIGFFNIAIESGCAETQKRIKKYVPLGKVKKLIDYIRSRGSASRCFYMLGFPGETKEQMQETIEFAADVRADWSRFAPVVPLVGTEVYEQFKDYLPDEETLWSNTFFSKILFDTPEVKARELMEIIGEGFVYANIIRNTHLRLGRFDEAFIGFKNIVRQQSGIEEIQVVVTLREDLQTAKVKVVKGECLE